MDSQRLKHALEGYMGQELSSDMVDAWLTVRRDCATGMLERAAPGKFVETVVQALQFIARGTFDRKPNVDDYLDKRAETEQLLPEGLRICAARIARAMYTQRNKRNIAHKNDVDCNTHDLMFLHQSATWIITEFLRHASGVSMQEAGALIEMIQTPVGTLVEEIDGVRLVHIKGSLRTEILILLHSHYPNYVAVASLLSSLSRRPQAHVRARLRELHASKHAHGDRLIGYKLTTPGYAAAVAEISHLLQKD